MVDSQTDNIYIGVFEGVPLFRNSGVDKHRCFGFICLFCDIIFGFLDDRCERMCLIVLTGGGLDLLASCLLASLGGSSSLRLLGGGLGDQHRVDVGQHTTLSNGHTTEKLVELLVVADSQLDVAGDDAGLLVVAGSVTSQLQDLSRQVLKDRGKVDGGTGTHTGGELALLQEAADTADRELKSSLGGSGLRLLVGLATAALATFSSTFSRHI